MGRLGVTPLRAAVVVAASILLGAGGAYAATLPIVSTRLWAGKQALTKHTCSLGAAAEDDTWINQSSRNQPNGGDTTLSIQGKNNSEEDALVRFVLTGCGLATTGGADSATLSLYVTAATKTNHTISLYPVYSSWSSSSLTWSSAQSLTVGSTATTSFTTTTGAKTLTVTADVDAAIKAGALWGWELVDTGGSGNATTTIAAAANGTASRRPALSVSDEQ
jgi:hypothetical protein